jgi:hypothetical protein
MAENPREKIPTKTVLDVDLLNQDVIGGSNIKKSSAKKQDETDLNKDIYDKQYANSNKKHRNLLSKLNHWFVIVSHPFSLVIIFLIVFLVFLITRYIDAGFYEQNDVISKISSDSETALSYLGTIIITSVFTKFLERKKK